MSIGLIATASIRIDAPVEKVWEALVNPGLIKKYMFGTEVITDWKVGSPIVWKGIWDGKSYEDKGIIIKKELLKTLVFTHFSPLTGIPDVQENYHSVTYELDYYDDHTHVTLWQDNNRNEKERKHSQENWERVLAGLKKVIED